MLMPCSYTQQVQRDREPFLSALPSQRLISLGVWRLNSFSVKSRVIWVRDVVFVSGDDLYS